ncbi:hypothetical protein J0667_03335 [Methylomonas sp. WH-1]
MKTPSEELVELIAPMLVKDGLLLPEDVEKSKAKIAAGTMKAEDWSVLADKAFGKGESQ